MFDLLENYYILLGTILGLLIYILLFIYILKRSAQSFASNINYLVKSEFDERLKTLDRVSNNYLNLHYKFQQTLGDMDNLHDQVRADISSAIIQEIERLIQNFEELEQFFSVRIESINSTLDEDIHRLDKLLQSNKYIIKLQGEILKFEQRRERNNDN